MKILIPMSSRIPLLLSAFAAAAVHAAVLGFSPAAFDHDPLPEISSSKRCETISYIPEKHPVREPVKKAERKLLKQESSREKKPPNDMPSSKTEKKQAARSCTSPVRQRVENNKARKETDQREKAQAPVREKTRQREERTLKPVETEGQADQAIFKAPIPLVEVGFKPEYPWPAEQKNLQGRVELLITISPEGRVLHASIHKSCGHSTLDNSAVSQVKKISFEPGLSKEGEPLESTVIWGWDFELDG